MEQFRDYLLALTQAEMEPWLRLRLDPVDVVNQTLLKAHRHRDQLRGHSLAQHLGWLRKILRNLLIDARRRFRSRPEVQFGGCGGDSSDVARPEEWLVADQSSPSQRAMRRELIQRLHEAMAGLADDRRTALELRYLHGLSVPEVARRMDRSLPAVAGLLRRGLADLRAMLAETQ